MTLQPDRPGATVVPVRDPGLGNTSYVVDLGGGRALAVDPSIDLRAVVRTAGERDLRIVAAVETHLHADFVSGLRRLVDEGVRALAPAQGGRRFAHEGLRDGDEVPLGGLTVTALGTPGHTPDHLAYVLGDRSGPLGVFTGGSLIVGGAARTDLVDPTRTEELARAQYASLRRLLGAVPGEAAVWPTHGAGSFCSAEPGRGLTSSVERELATNPLLGAPDEETFVRALLAGLGSYPAYFRRLQEVNRTGRSASGTSAHLARLEARVVQRLRRSGAVVVDARSPLEFAAGHLPGSLSNPLRPAFGTWLGWLLDIDQSLVVVRGRDQDPEEIVWQARKVGFGRLAGELDGGVGAWARAGLPVDVLDVATVADLEAGRRADALSDAMGLRPTIVDVRQRDEYAAGHLPGAVNVELGELAGRVDALPPGPLVTVCAHGERASTAASVLRRAGRPAVSVFVGEQPALAAAPR